MKTMVSRVRAYLAYRRALGFRARSEGSELLSFARYADRSEPGGPLTKKTAIAWARLSEGGRHSWARRLQCVRRLAKHLFVDDPRTEIPPRHFFGPVSQTFRPFIYKLPQIKQLISAARQLSGDLRPQTISTLIGLLACTGLRISEALHLKVVEVDLRQGLLLVRQGKFQQTRWVPLHPTALRPLQAYARQRQQRFPLAEYFFTSEQGGALSYTTVRSAFVKLRQGLVHKGQLPRIHDLRHYHACCILQRWQCSRRGAQTRVLILSRYLGHRHIRYTYWYLHALPELMAHAGKRFEKLTHEKL
jgi:integrase